MEKIFNTQRLNIYGGAGMINKYVYMLREFNNADEHYIYKISKIINDKFPIKYECERYNCLIIPKDKNKKSLEKDHIKEIELTNNDVLYEIDNNEYMAIFRTFIDLYNTTIKVDKHVFINHQ